MASYEQVAFYDQGSDRGRLGVPQDIELDRDTVVALCSERLGVRVRVDAAVWRRVRSLALDVGWWDRGEVFTFLAGGWYDRARFEVPAAAVRADSLRGLVNLSDPDARPGAAAIALALAVCWDDPALRMRLEPARWRRALKGLTAEHQPEVATDDRADASLQVELLLTDDRDPTKPFNGCMTLSIVPLSKRTGKPLKPKKAPRSLEVADRKYRLPEGDRRVLRLAEQRQLMGHIRTYRYGDSVTVDAEVERLDTELFSALDEASAVLFRGAPLALGQPPWRPCIRVLDAEAGLELRWVEVPVAFLGDDHIIDHDNALRPLADDVPRRVAQALMSAEPLPHVPADQIDDFIEEFVLAAGVPVRLEARSLQASRSRPEPRLLISEAGAALRVEARFGYGDAQVDPAAAAPVIQAADRLVQRNKDAEAAALDGLKAWLPGAPPCELAGDAAFDFLLDALPQLNDWSVFFDEGARKRRPKGQVRTETSVQSGVDWFDLQVDFQVAGRSISQREVLRAWAEGHRYVQLADGAVARLPGDWLKRHGAALAELSELRRANDGKLGAFAAPLAARLLGDAPAEVAERWQAVAEKVQSFDGVADRPIPKSVKATLRDYQHRGFRWLCALRELGLGGLLADDMGLGKTLQTLAFLADVHADPAAGQSLVVAPTSVVHNWIEEAKRFVPSLSIALHHGSQRGAPDTDAQIIVTSYALMRIDREHLEQRDFAVVVLDEAQAIKTPTSQVAQAARALRARTRIALTGTPIENNLLELWSLMQFAMPGFFGGKAAFTRRYATPIQHHDNADALNALRRRVRPFVLRRLKDEVARELPPRQEQVLYCELGAAQRRLYEKVRTTYAATVMSAVAAKGVGASTIQVLEALTRLRQACCDPALLPMAEAAGVKRSAKRERLMETVHALIDDGHRALVFSQWPSLLKLVRADLDQAAIPYLYLDGSTKERGDLQKRWNRADGPPLFLISLKAGGTGLNLTAADHVIHLDPWWNPAVEQQATDRAHRIGQTRPVMVYKFVARGTVEEKILELQARKRALAEAAVDGDRVAVDALSRADLEAVFAPLGEAPTEAPEPEPSDDAAPIDDAAAALDALPPALATLDLRDAGATTAAVADALAVSAATARKRLKGWVEAGHLVKSGRGRGVRYRLP